MTSKKQKEFEKLLQDEHMPIPLIIERIEAYKNEAMEKTKRLRNEQLINQLSDIQEKIKYRSLCKRDDVVKGLQELIDEIS